MDRAREGLTGGFDVLKFARVAALALLVTLSSSIRKEDRLSERLLNMPDIQRIIRKEVMKKIRDEHVKVGKYPSRRFLRQEADKVIQTPEFQRLIRKYYEEELLRGTETK